MARNEETDIANSILLELSGPECLAWKQTVGAFRAYHNPQRVVSVGVPGMADIMTVRAVTITPDMVGKTIGVAVAHEVKTKNGDQRDTQRKWQAAFEKRGGIYLLTRSPDQARSQTENLRAIISGR